jgi:hypothetical protein
VDPIIKASYARYIAKNPHLAKKRGKRLRHRNIVLKELLSRETDKIKTEVDERRRAHDLNDKEDVVFGDDTLDEVELRRRKKVRALQRKVLFFFFF